MTIEIKMMPEMLDDGDPGVAAMIVGQPQGLLWAKSKTHLYMGIDYIQRAMLAAERERRSLGTETGEFELLGINTIIEDGMFALQWHDVPGFGVCFQNMKDYESWIAAFIREAADLLDRERK